MQRVLRKFTSSPEADEAEAEYYLSLTPEQRLEILLDLIASARDEKNEAAEGLERIYRVVKLQDS